MLLKRFNTEHRAEKVNDRTFRFVISDESVDRYDTIITASGWQLENYAKNSIVAYQHNTFSDDPDMIVGKGKAWLEGNRLMGEVEFEPEGMNSVADKLVKKLEFGSINATSVGFNPIEYTRGDKTRGENPELIYFRKQDLLEFSIVNIPANPNATQDKDYTEFIRMIKEDQKMDEVETIQNEKRGLDEFTTLYLRSQID